VTSPGYYYPDEEINYPAYQHCKKCDTCHSVTAPCLASDRLDYLEQRLSKLEAWVADARKAVQW
jgi:hypothetical protein